MHGALRHAARTAVGGVGGRSKEEACVAANGDMGLRALERAAPEADVPGMCTRGCTDGGTGGRQLGYRGGIQRVQRQLELFGEEDVFLERFTMLGREHRRRGGAPLHLPRPTRKCSREGLRGVVHRFVAFASTPSYAASAGSSLCAFWWHVLSRRLVGGPLEVKPA